MELHTVFMVHAPEPPEWFQLDRMTSPPIFSVLLSGLDDDTRQEILDKWDEEDYEWIDIPSSKAFEEVKNWMEAHKKKEEEERLYPEKRWFAWRKYYADKMVKQVKGDK